MIHGNSSAGAIFAPQLEGEIGRNWRIIAPDLPGHGRSGDALDPDRSYSMEGYADAMTEVLENSAYPRRSSSAGRSAAISASR